MLPLASEKKKKKIGQSEEKKASVAISTVHTNKQTNNQNNINNINNKQKNKFSPNRPGKRKWK